MNGTEFSLSEISVLNAWNFINYVENPGNLPFSCIKCEGESIIIIAYPQGVSVWINRMTSYVFSLICFQETNSSGQKQSGLSRFQEATASIDIGPVVDELL